MYSGRGFFGSLPLSQVCVSFPFPVKPLAIILQAAQLFVLSLIAFVFVPVFPLLFDGKHRIGFGSYNGSLLRLNRYSKS